MKDEVFNRECTTHNRDGWTARYRVSGGRAAGWVYYDSDPSKSFDVKIKKTGFFDVSIGSSGAKLSFKHKGD